MYVKVAIIKEGKNAKLASAMNYTILYCVVSHFICEIKNVKDNEKKNIRIFPIEYLQLEK